MNNIFEIILKAKEQAMLDLEELGVLVDSNAWKTCDLKEANENISTKN